MNQPLVSVVVPLYNQEAYIKDALSSVSNQTYPNWEVIVMDDSSTDHGKEIVQEILKADSRFRLYSQPNSGPSVARNECIARSTGKYILPLDGDDMIAPTYIEKAVDYLESHPNCKLVYCKAEKFGAESGIWPLTEYKYEKLLWENMIFCTAMYRREDYDKTNGYNPNMIFGIEDWDFWLSLLSPDAEVHQIDEVLFFYRTKSISRTTLLTPRIKEATKQLWMNHIELYAKNSNIIFMHNDLIRKEKELHNLLNSNTYKLGRVIAAPYKYIKKKLKHLKIRYK